MLWALYPPSTASDPDSEFDRFMSNRSATLSAPAREVPNHTAPDTQTTGGLFMVLQRSIYAALALALLLIGTVAMAMSSHLLVLGISFNALD
jgi:hypothetical protein